MTSHWNVSFAQLADPSVSWGDLFADWIAEMDTRRDSAKASGAKASKSVGRAYFLEPLPTRVPPRPALRIRLPPLKVWTCDQCACVYPNDVYGCDNCAMDGEDSEEEGEGEYDPWYCCHCDDFCPNGAGICRRCQWGAP
jgi:hypothetical protein